MMHKIVRAVALAALLTVSNASQAAPTQPVPATADLSDADVADLFLAAPLILTARITRAVAIKPVIKLAPGAANAQLYLEGDVVRLVRGQDAVAAHLAWVATVPLDGRGRPPKLAKTLVLLAALPVPGRPGSVQLAARDAMQPWTAALEARVRAIVAAGLAPGAPPRITGVASAFHVAGNLPGEGETQIFLVTGAADGTAQPVSLPVSLTVITRPNQARRWAVALGEIVDEAAAPPARGTLGWYRLACALPPALPGSATVELAPADAAVAQDDYRFVIESLGACGRTRR